MIKLALAIETVGSVAMVSDAVELERLDESNSTSRFHRVDGRLAVEVSGEAAEVGWSPKSQKGVMLVGEVLSEQVGRTVESVDHTPNVLKIVARN